MIKQIGIAYLNSNQNICKGLITKNLDESRTIVLYNSNGAEIAKLIYYYKYDRAVINYIYCFQGSRGKGVGSKLLDILEACVARRSKAIVGMFTPFQEESDISVYGLDKKIYANAEKFYKNNKYRIIHFDTDVLLEARIRYSDFLFDNTEIRNIIFKETKDITPKSEFFGDVLFDKELYDVPLKKEDKKNRSKA